MLSPPGVIAILRISGGNDLSPHFQSQDTRRRKLGVSDILTACIPIYACGCPVPHKLRVAVPGFDMHVHDAQLPLSELTLHQGGANILPSLAHIARSFPVAPRGAEFVEAPMKKVLVLTLLGLFATLGLASQKAMAQEQKEGKAAPAVAPKEGRWHGTLIRINKDASTLQVRRSGTERTIHYDSSTKWTRGTKRVDMSEFKEGADVICIGTFEKDEFHATRVDLRRE